MYNIFKEEKGWRKFINSFEAGLLGIFLMGGGFTAFLIYGVPWLWHFVKPFIHRITQ